MDPFKYSFYTVTFKCCPHYAPLFIGFILNVFLFVSFLNKGELIRWIIPFLNLIYLKLNLSFEFICICHDWKCRTCLQQHLILLLICKRLRGFQAFVLFVFVLSFSLFKFVLSFWIMQFWYLTWVFYTGRTSLWEA